MSIRRLFLQQAQAVASTDFIIEVKTDNAGTSLDNQFTIPTTTGTYLYDVTTSDGQTILGNTGNLTITFPSAGTYDINISGDFPRILLSGTTDKLKLTDIKNWGNIEWTSMNSAFFGCNNLTAVTATDTPDLSSVVDMRGMFNSCSQMTSIDVSNWDVSNTALYSQTFIRCYLLNIDVSNWDTSSFTKVDNMFNDCDAFDYGLANWNIDNIADYNGFMNNATGLSTANYDATLISWAAQTPSLNEVPNFGGSQYTLGGAAEAARNTLINTYGWTITDGGGI